MGFIMMTEPSKLIQKAIGRPNATWNTVKQRGMKSFSPDLDRGRLQLNHIIGTNVYSSSPEPQKLCGVRVAINYTPT